MSDVLRGATDAELRLLSKAAKTAQDDGLLARIKDERARRSHGGSGDGGAGGPADVDVPVDMNEQLRRALDRRYD